MQFLKTALAAGVAAAMLTGSALAQGKPSELKIGITTFLSGPASVFGVPGKAAAEMIAEDINKKGGIGGVPVKLSFVDEGAGGEALVSNYRRMVQDEKVDATFASISSGSCNQLVPVAEDLKVMNLMWDCGAASILETKKYRYNFRTQANGTPEMLAVLIYLLKQTRLQDHCGHQPGLRLGPRKLGNLFDRAEGHETRRAGGGGAVPQVRLT
jgi:branched-chain amino acid transport system substrate-binding protein